MSGIPTYDKSALDLENYSRKINFYLLFIFIYMTIKSEKGSTRFNIVPVLHIPMPSGQKYAGYEADGSS